MQGLVKDLIAKVRPQVMLAIGLIGTIGIIAACEGGEVGWGVAGTVAGLLGGSVIRDLIASDKEV